MPAASARERSSSAGLLSIGQVLARLSPEFPTLTSSKLRFLEVQGIVTPAAHRVGLPQVLPGRPRAAAPRAHAAARSLPAARRDPRVSRRRRRRPRSGARRPPCRRRRSCPRRAATAARSCSPRPAPRRSCSTTRSAPACSTGSDAYTDQSVALLRALVALDRHGIEPRHVRALRQSAERDVALVESALAPLLRRTDAASRGRAERARARAGQAPRRGARDLRALRSRPAAVLTPPTLDRDTPSRSRRMSLPRGAGLI